MESVFIDLFVSHILCYLVELHDSNVSVLQGRLLGKVDAYFSSFRRCNYPRVTAQGGIEIVEECGRYSR
jgi:hypothetical protein